MFPSACIPAVRQRVVSRRIFPPRAGLNGWILAATAALTLCTLEGAALEAQTAHFGSVVTLGSGFTTPTGVAVDANGNVFVADFGNSAIKEIMAVNGTIPASPVINTLGSGFSTPFTVAVDASGNVFLTDYGHKQVKEMVAVGGVIPASPTIRILGGGFSFLFGTTVDAHGNVFVTDYGHNAVKEIVAVNGVIPALPKILSLGSGFNIPAGVAVDRNGNVFIGDQNNNAVKEILASSGYTTTNIVANSGFNTPDGIAIDKYGDIFVADDGNSLVKEVVAVNGVIPPSPTILTLGNPAGGDFLQTFDVAVDGKGNVYVADRGHNAVKEILMAPGDFGTVSVGTTTLTPIALSFTFDTAGTLGSTSVVTMGNTGMDFFDSGGGSCIANTFYSAGQSCTVNVKFGPLAPGPRYGAVKLLDGNGNQMASGGLLGIGAGPQATFATTTSGVSLPASVFNVGGGFNAPGGLAVDASGNVFVGDSYNNAVEKVTAASGWTTPTVIGSGFSFPNGVALDGAGNVYVADTFNDAVKEIVAAGGYSTVLTLGSGFSDPYSVAVDGHGNVFVADFSNGAVKEILATNGVISPTPTIRTLASGINGPDGVAVDGNGNVFFASYFDGTVMGILAVNGSIPPSPVIYTIVNALSGPSNLAVDGIGNLYFTDTYDGLVGELISQGGGTFSALRTVGSGFNAPDALAVWSNGDVAVADAGANTVQFLDYADTPALTFATTPVGLTSTDSPQTVTLSNDGNMPLNFTVPVTGKNPSVPTSFVWSPTSSCVQTTPSSSQFQLAGGTSCTMVFNFKPTSANSFSSFATSTDNNLNVPNSAQSIQLIGTGTAPAALTSPAANSVLVGPKVTFTWSAATGATGYAFRLGTAVGGNNLYSSGTITTTSATPTNLPTHGATIYGRLITFYGARQVVTDYVFTAATQSAIISPAGNSVFPGATVTFNWSAATGSPTGYGFRLGTTVGGNNIYSSGTVSTTTVTRNNLPTNGATIYARLFTFYGTIQVYTDYVYTAAP